MKIFKEQPEITKEDKKRFLEIGYLDGWNKLVVALKEHPPTEDDLKKLILLELKSEIVRIAILEKLIVRLQKCERAAINKAILQHNPKLIAGKL